MPPAKRGGCSPSCSNTDETCSMGEPWEPAAALGLTKTQAAPHIGQVAGIGVESGGTSGRPVAVDSLTLRKIEISRCSISTDTRRVRFMATMCHAKPRRVIGRGSKARQFRLNCTSIQRVAPFGGGFFVMNGRITAARRRPAKYGSIPAKEPLRSFTRATRRGPTRPATPHADKIRP